MKRSPPVMTPWQIELWRRLLGFCLRCLWLVLGVWLVYVSFGGLVGCEPLWRGLLPAGFEGDIVE